LCDNWRGGLSAAMAFYSSHQDTRKEGLLLHAFGSGSTGREVWAHVVRTSERGLTSGSQAGVSSCMRTEMDPVALSRVGHGGTVKWFLLIS
jgi:hypothetical protein